MMVRVWLAAAVLAAVAAAIPSPTSIRSDMTILINNDLQGEQHEAPGTEEEKKGD